LWEGVQGFSVYSKCSLQLSLVGVKTTELKKRTNACILVGSSVTETGSVKFRAVAEY
jgi:hypothetical protein